MDFNNIIAYMACIFFLFIFGRLFIIPIKIIVKLLINSILGGFLIFLINLIGVYFNFHIGINLITSIFVGILGIPGVIIIIIIRLIL